MATDPRLKDVNDVKATVNVREDRVIELVDPDAKIIDRDVKSNPDVHADPITGAPHSHPLGVGVGAAVGGGASAVIGAAIGSVVAPGIGTTVGAVTGAIVGAFGGGEAGHDIAASTNPDVEEEYWRQNYKTRPYVSSTDVYDDYAPAYRYGWESRTRMTGRNYDQAERDLEAGWNNFRGGSKLGWEKAKSAAKDAWDRASSPTSWKDEPHKSS
jgi:hypothetical protein